MSACSYPWKMEHLNQMTWRRTLIVRSHNPWESYHNTYNWRLKNHGRSRSIITWCKFYWFSTCQVSAHIIPLFINIFPILLINESSCLFTVGSTTTESCSSWSVTDPTGPCCVSNSSFVFLTHVVSASNCSMKCWHSITLSANTRCFSGRLPATWNKTWPFMTNLSQFFTSSSMYWGYIDDDFLQLQRTLFKNKNHICTAFLNMKILTSI